VKKDTKNTVMAVAVVIAVFASAYGGLLLYSGMSSPFYTVESGSMMHSAGSKVGILDTGDMVLVRDPSKMNITTYVDGCKTGYEKFGDHGDVIIYDRYGGTPVIHRAMLYAVYNGGGTWDIPSLDDYDVTKWSCGGTAGAYHDMLTLKNVGYKDTDVLIDLDALASGLAAGTAGYVTMGDNNAPVCDLFVSEDRVVAVATHEVPWLGCVKLFLTGNNASPIPTNSVVWLVVSLIAIVVSVVGLWVIIERLRKKRK
jgi:signal peptidase